MSSKLRTLTKSRFKIGHECPTKLFYAGKSEYGNKKDDDSFLKALASGGFQVGALAQAYHQGGFEIATLDTELALALTKTKLSESQVTLFEAAVRHDSLLIRVDILKKSNDQFKLIEVKAKSWDDESSSFFLKGEKGIIAKWEPYLIDIAFQTHVTRLAYPNVTVTPYLMLTDKTKLATVEGLNQKFYLKKENGRERVISEPSLTAADLGKKILKEIDVSAEVEFLLRQRYLDNRFTFGEYVDYLAKNYVLNTKMESQASKACKSCEFRISQQMKSEGKKSGFDECWKARGIADADLSEPFVFDIAHFRSENVLAEPRYLARELDEDDFNETKPKKLKSGLTRSQRQVLQVDYIKDQNPTAYLDKTQLAEQFVSWTYPLHFIDFETTMVAVPFNKGRRPYEQIAFQFSHHIIYKDGTVEHSDEYLNRTRGEFPNFEFLRRLKGVLENDKGTIFRYSHHENTVLGQIREQIRATKPNLHDEKELLAFIESITHSGDKSFDKWEGARDMVDLCDMVQRFYYHPLTNGSNSIKKVLPAILNDSKFLQERYSKPTYGVKNGMKSKNFKNHAWIQFTDGKVQDPYKLLGQVFDDYTVEQMDAQLDEDDVADGGAAMTAYVRMQFTQISEAECAQIAEKLLRYCELDTLAMVMIFEHWKNELNHSNLEQI